MSTLLYKAGKAVVNYITRGGGGRGTLSSYVKDSPHELGQPLSTTDQQGDVLGIITPERMRELAMRTPTVGASVNATLDYTSGVQIKVRNKNPSLPAQPDRLRRVKELMDRPNPDDTWGQLRYKTERDIITIGWGAWEIERDQYGQVYHLWAVDAARLKIDFNEHGSILGFNMLDITGQPIRAAEDGVHTWLPKDILYFPRDPASHSVYSTSRIAQLFSLGVLEDLMLQFISTRFTDSNIPYGMLDLGDITEQELEAAVDMWNSQAQKQHKIMLTGSKGGSKWYPFAYALKELEAKELLAMVKSGIMGIMGVTENELGESQDVNKSNGYNLSFTFKKRAIEPVLRIEDDVITKRLFYEELGYEDMEAYCDEIDSRDELLQGQIDDIFLKSGIYTINHIRNKKGLTSIPGGDINYIFTGSAYIPVHLLNAFAEAQLAAIMAVEGSVSPDDSTTSPVGQGRAGPGNPNISPPLIRPPKMPESFTTPDGSGSENVKITYPNKLPQKTRGPTQTLRSIGLRKEEMTR